MGDLVDAVKNNQLEKVIQLLEEGSLSFYSDLSTAFSFACQTRNLKIASVLIKCMDFKYENELLLNLLVEAEKNNHDDIIKLILTKVFFLDIPLTHFFDGNYRDIRNKVVSFQQNPFSYIELNLKVTPLTFVNQSLASGLLRNKDSIFLAALSYNQKDIVNYFINNNYVTKFSVSTEEIWNLIENGREEAINFFLKNNMIDPAECNSTILYTAVVYPHSNILKLLLEDGRADPSIDHYKILVPAVKSGFAENVKLLLEDSRFNISLVKATMAHDLLEQVISYDNFTLLHRLLKAGFRPFNKSAQDYSESEKIWSASKDMKLIGNILGLSGNAMSKGATETIEIEYEGEHNSITFNAISEHLRAFYNDIIKDADLALHSKYPFNDPEKKAIGVALEAFDAVTQSIGFSSIISSLLTDTNTSNNAISINNNFRHQAERYLQDKPIIIPCNWPAHTGCAVLYKNKFYVVNRGPGAVQRGIDCYQFNPQDITNTNPPELNDLTTFIGNISTQVRPVLKEGDDTNLELADLKRLNMQRLTPVIFKPQAQGNCAYTNPKHAIYAIFLLLKEEACEIQKKLDTGSVVITQEMTEKIRFQNINVRECYNSFAEFDRLFSTDWYYQRNKNSINQNKWAPLIEYLQHKNNNSPRFKKIKDHILHLLPELKNNVLGDDKERVIPLLLSQVHDKKIQNDNIEADSKVEGGTKPTINPNSKG